MSTPMNFVGLVSVIEQTHRHFQQQAVKAVNVSLTIRNWLVGCYIVEFEQHGEDRASYGVALLDRLATEIKIKGLVSAELSRCRQFYFCYPQILGLVTQEFKSLLPSAIVGSLTQEFDSELKRLNEMPINPESSAKKLQVPAGKLLHHLSYTHLVELIKIQDHLKRTFYEIECIKGTWSVRELKRQIHSLYFERCGMSAKPEMLSKLTQSKTEIEHSTDIIKSVYAFEFLGLNAKDAIEENDLESALLNHLQLFMLEMGHGFCFEARQKKILIDDEYYFIDLVFYHRILKCHVLVELKMKELKHHNIGQLNTYVAYYNAEVKRPDDNPAIGILLCTEKGKKLVEYATAGMDQQLFVSKYLLELPKKEQLEAFIEKELELWK
jgi:predicted nuclease of restriction endonuclease-like (RecB) superfamily